MRLCTENALQECATIVRPHCCIKRVTNHVEYTGCIESLLILCNNGNTSLRRSRLHSPAYRTILSSVDIPYICYCKSQHDDGVSRFWLTMGFPIVPRLQVSASTSVWSFFSRTRPDECSRVGKHLTSTAVCSFTLAR